jgi:hypothetical protein
VGHGLPLRRASIKIDQHPVWHSSALLKQGVKGHPKGKDFRLTTPRSLCAPLPQPADLREGVLIREPALVLAPKVSVVHAVDALLR